MSGNQWFTGEVQSAPPVNANPGGAAMGALQRLQNKAWFQGQPQAKQAQQAMQQAAADPRWFTGAPKSIQQQSAPQPPPMQSQPPAAAPQKPIQQQSAPQSPPKQSQPPPPMQKPAAPVAQKQKPAAPAAQTPAAQSLMSKPSPALKKATASATPLNKSAAPATNKLASALKSAPNKAASSVSPLNKLKGGASKPAKPASDGSIQLKLTLDGDFSGFNMMKKTKVLSDTASKLGVAVSKLSIGKCYAGSVIVEVKIDVTGLDSNAIKGKVPTLKGQSIGGYPCKGADIAPAAGAAPTSLEANQFALHRLCEKCAVSAGSYTISFSYVILLLRVPSV